MFPAAKKNELTAFFCFAKKKEPGARVFESQPLFYQKKTKRQTNKQTERQTDKLMSRFLL
jgi:hypothetical protein